MIHGGTEEAAASHRCTFATVHLEPFGAQAMVAVPAQIQPNHGAAYSRSSMLGSSMFLTMSCTVSAMSLVHR
jgi:hypothetical protein